jgi:hypothetical protein
VRERENRGHPTLHSECNGLGVNVSFASRPESGAWLVSRCFDSAFLFGPTLLRGLKVRIIEDSCRKNHDPLSVVNCTTYVSNFLAFHVILFHAYTRVNDILCFETFLTVWCVSSSNDSTETSAGWKLWVGVYASGAGLLACSLCSFKIDVNLLILPVCRACRGTPL